MDTPEIGGQGSKSISISAAHRIRAPQEAVSSLSSDHLLLLKGVYGVWCMTILAFPKFPHPLKGLFLTLIERSTSAIAHYHVHSKMANAKV